jgi:hypothetical protein
VEVRILHLVSADELAGIGVVDRSHQVGGWKGGVFDVLIRRGFMDVLNMQMDQLLRCFGYVSCLLGTHCRPFHLLHDHSSPSLACRGAFCKRCSTQRTHSVPGGHASWVAASTAWRGLAADQHLPRSSGS